MAMLKNQMVNVIESLGMAVNHASLPSMVEDPSTQTFTKSPGVFPRSYISTWINHDKSIVGPKPLYKKFDGPMTHVFATHPAHPSSSSSPKIRSNF
jgi:hypothetical protein